MKERMAGLDIIRTFAICMVMLTHMFGYHMGLVDNRIQTASWTVFVFFKFLATTGVPLFLLLTGYLQSKRELNKKHYLSIIPVLVSYFVISLINTLAEQGIFATEFKPYRQIINIFDFEYGYAWYVEMYIGLFLLIPFLNILYRNISKKQKLWLIAALSFLSFLPSTLQYISVAGGPVEVLPDFFKNLYPFAYYFIGAYIAEYQPKPKKLLCIGAFLLVLVFETALCYWGSKVEYAWWFFNNVASVTHAVVAVSFFLLFYDVRARFFKVPAKLVAACSFEMYLLSYITDKICYEFLALPTGIDLVIDFLFVFAAANLVRVVTVPLGNALKQIKPEVKKTTLTG